MNRLHISALNVRKTDRDLDIDQLADSIDERGLLQNLVVVPEGPSAHFGVVAGGRRLLALQLLAERGRIAADWPVPVVREKRVDGREISLSENLDRVDMNPADEFEAFAAIIADYEARGEADREVRVERCARHFSQSVRHVEQRLRLAALHPEILDALRTSTISLESAKAYAAYPDQDLQFRVFRDMEGIRHAVTGHAAANRHSVAAIRAALAGRVYRTSMRAVRYVGLDAYVEAGGRVVRELFMGTEDEDVLLDTALLDQLCAAKAEIEVAAVAHAAGYAGGLLAPSAAAVWPAAYELPKTPKGYLLVHGGAQLLGPDDAAGAILICRIAGDGGRIEPTENYFRLYREPVRAGVAIDSSSSAAASTRVSFGAPAKGESEIERLARIRRHAIEARAARLAAPPIAGTPLEGRASWPAADVLSVRPVMKDPDGDYVVAILVTIRSADVDRRMGEAERAFDAEESPRVAAAQGLASPHDLTGDVDIMRWPVQSRELEPAA